MSQHNIDGLDVGAGQAISLILVLDSCRVGQSTSSPPLSCPW